MRKIKETYKDIPGYEGHYQVSVRGNVRSLARVDTRGNNRKEKQLKPGLKSNGYRSVALTKDGKVKHLTVHQLVMSTFIGPPPEGMNIDHYDQNKLNNKLCNLSYMTIGDNNYRSKKNSTSTHRNVCFDKYWGKWIARITIDGKKKHLGSFKTEQEAVEVIKEFKNK